MQVIEPAPLINQLTLRRNASGLSALVAGLGLIAAAILFSNGAIEHALVSNPTRSLAWGPALFRALLAVHGVALLVVALVSLKSVGRPAISSMSSALSLDESRSTTWRSWVALSVLTMLALALRLWHLNTDLWFDELLTLLNFVRLPLGDIVTSLPDQNNHLLFSVLSNFSVRVAVSTESSPVFRSLIQIS